MSPFISSFSGNRSFGRGGSLRGLPLTIELWGAGGGPGTPGGWNYGADGGGGGYTLAKYEVFDSMSLKIIAGRQGLAGDWWGGDGGGTLVYGGGGGASSTNGDNRYSAGGGGFSGVFVDSTIAANTLAMAGGGGGGSGSYAAHASCGDNAERGGAGGGVNAFSGHNFCGTYTGNNGYGGQQVSHPRFVQNTVGGCLYNSASHYRTASQFFGGTTISNSYGGGGGGGWYGGDAGVYYNCGPNHSMGGGGGGSGHIAGSMTVAPSWSPDTNRTARWFSAGYFGVESNSYGQLTNGVTYDSVSIMNPGSDGNKRMWILFVENTTGNEFKVLWGGKFRLPSSSSGEMANFSFSESEEIIGNPTIPSSGTYYKAWLSGDPSNTGNNPTNSLWGQNASGAGGSMKWVVFGSVSGGATPVLNKVYTTNDGSGDAHIQIHLSGYRSGVNTLINSKKVKLTETRNYAGSFRTPGYTGGNYPGGNVGHGAPNNNNQSSTGRGYVRINVNGTVYTYDNSSTNGSISTLNITI